MAQVEVESIVQWQGSTTFRFIDFYGESMQKFRVNKRRLLFVVLASILFSSVQIQISSADTSPLSTVSSDTNVEVNLQGIDYVINSSNGTNQDLYFSNSKDFLDTEINRWGDSRFSLEITSKNTNSYMLRITPNRPLIETCYDLYISQNSDGMNAIQRGICTPGAYSQKLYSLKNFDFFCNTSQICRINSYFEGEFSDEWAADVITVAWQVRTKGTKQWAGYPPTEYPLSEDIKFVDYVGTSEPEEVRALITYRGKKYTTSQATVLPIPKLTIRAPGAAIVGSNFKVVVNAPKSYSANCDLNSNAKFSIKNGIGRVTVYGRMPGRTILIVSCSPNSHWAAALEKGEIYIRE